MPSAFRVGHYNSINNDLTFNEFLEFSWTFEIVIKDFIST